MEKRVNDIRVLSYGLVFIYGTGLCVYLLAFVISLFDPRYILDSSLFAGTFSGIGQFRREAIFAGTLFFPQWVAAVAMTRSKDWGRQLFIGMNLVTCLYILYYDIVLKGYGNFIANTYAMISLMTILFFIQPRVKEAFEDPFDGFTGKRILVIDDDRILLKMVKTTLTNNGYRVMTAASGERGLELARTKKPALIFLDVILPRMKGREVCLQMKQSEATRRIPIVFLTSKDSPDDVRAELSAGGISHLTKPVNPQKLLSEIKRILGY